MHSEPQLETEDADAPLGQLSLPKVTELTKKGKNQVKPGASGSRL
jgi:hypothetical protein